MTKTGLEFSILVIVICPSAWLRVVSPSTLLRTVSLSNGWSNHLDFVICYLEFLLTLTLCDFETAFRLFWQNHLTLTWPMEDFGMRRRTRFSRLI